jgi:CubicO group peptidase (beta-lactamase class C family)
LARQAPCWEPGTASGYHALSIGHLVSEIIRRVTGRTLGEFFAEEVTAPLGADYHIGTGPECDDRVSLLIPASPIPKPSGESTLADRAHFNPAATPFDSRTIVWRRAEVGAANGHGNARSAAAVQSILACACSPRPGASGSSRNKPTEWT